MTNPEARRLARDPKDLPYFLTVSEAAALLRMSLRAVYLRIANGELPGSVRVGGKEGGRILINRDVLLASLEEARDVA